MFCSKCGKTLMPESTECSFCHAAVGESRFEAALFTSAQAPIPPHGEGGASAAYARTTFTSMTDAEISGSEMDGRTTYRPVQPGSAPEDVRQGMREAIRATAEGDATPEESQPEAEEKPRVTMEDLPEEALNALSAVEEELQLDALDTTDLQARPIESTGRAGISANVEQYMQRLEATRQRRKLRWPGRAREEVPVDEADASPAAPTFRRPAARQDASDDAGQPAEAPLSDVPRRRRRRMPDAQADVPAEGAAPVDIPEDAGEAGAPYDAQDLFDAPQPQDDAGDVPEEGVEDIEGEDFEDIQYERPFSIRNIIKVAVIMLLTAAVIVGGVLWFRSFRSRQVTAPIEGVSQALYDQGLAAIKSHTESDYVQELIDIYTGGGNNVTAFNERIQADSAALEALMPEEPAINDALYVSALQAIQNNIGAAILTDALDVQQGNTDNADASAARWSIVNGAIAQLEAASTAQELTAIQNSEAIPLTGVEATPEPTPQPTYATLVKDDKSDAVLEMQNRLYMLGFLRDDRDGSFGNKTQTAVKAFQQAAGLPVTGIADNETLTRLYADDAPRTQYAQVTPKPKN